MGTGFPPARSPGVALSRGSKLRRAKAGRGRSCAANVDKAKGRTLCVRRSDACAQVAELVDALVSGTSGESRGGSSPLLGTKLFPKRLKGLMFAIVDPYRGTPNRDTRVMHRRAIIRWKPRRLFPYSICDAGAS